MSFADVAVGVGAGSLVTGVTEQWLVIPLMVILLIFHETI